MHGTALARACRWLCVAGLSRDGGGAGPFGKREADMEGAIRLSMSDATAEKSSPKANARFEQVEDELRQEDTLGSLLVEQWRGMAGMAGMFVLTIALGIYIRPYYDVGELHAFGASGATQVRYVAIELVAIFVFTALIIFLARWGKEFIIKYGMYAVLTMAMMYSTVPLAHMLVLDFETEPFEATSNDLIEGDWLGTLDDGRIVTADIFGEAGDYDVNISVWSSDNAYAAPSWTTSHNHSFVGENSRVHMTVNGDMLTFANGAYAWTLSSVDGSVQSSYDCFVEGDEDGERLPLPNMLTGCSLAIQTDGSTDGEGSLYLVNNGDIMIRYATFDSSPGNLTQMGMWTLPSFGLGDEVFLQSHVLDTRTPWTTVPGDFSTPYELFIATEDLVGVVALETSNAARDINSPDNDQPATMLYQRAPAPDSAYSCVDVGLSPFEEVEAVDVPHDRRMVLLGEVNGDITGIEWNASANEASMFVEEERMLLSGLVDGVDAVKITDLDESGYADVLVAGDGQAHWFYTSSLVNRATFDVSEGITDVFFVVDGDDATLVTLAVDSTLLTTAVSQGPLTESMFPLYGLQLELWPTIAGLFVTGLLMVLLFVHSEWYVVNTTGVLLGAGVVVMLGVTFVPILAILFMILAAVYDAWAVYRSKHMLDLADTMIGLRLPILLVAPQDSNYSLIEETEGEAPRKTMSDQPVVKRPKKKGSEAMFMGLGDIIFPGMLVLSALQWLDPSGAFAVAMSTLVGGLVGYFALMTYVARGKAQAGLPLLNGGAILGYIIGGYLFLSGDVFQFNISW